MGDDSLEGSSISRKRKSNIQVHVMPFAEKVHLQSDTVSVTPKSENSHAFSDNDNTITQSETEKFIDECLGSSIGL